MERFLYKHLLNWKKDKTRKPILLRGARQVGKSYLVKQLGESFDNFVEANFEENPQLKKIFETNLNPNELLPKLSIALNCDIIPNDTLLFLDEIQMCPNALTSLRYFYEKLPELHVIAAGSLIDFVIEEIGLPVGRIRSIYVYPMSFSEYLIASDNRRLLELLQNHSDKLELEEIFHNKLLSLFGEYMAIGGMPAAVKQWNNTKNYKKISEIHNDIIDTYRQDFIKYAKGNQIFHVEKVFSVIPQMLGKKFIFSKVDESLRSREIKPALDLLKTAGVVHVITHSSSNDLPLNAQVNSSLFKVLFLDIALAKNLLGMNQGKWILEPGNNIINKGEIVESFIGQEILANSNPLAKKTLNYWVREKKRSQAEVDFVTDINNKVIPIEVKSGKTGSLKSLQVFLEEKSDSPYGLHFSQKNFYKFKAVKHYPIYAVSKAMLVAVPTY